MSFLHADSEVRKPRILYSSAFIPVEWISAHGFSPGRIIPRSGGSVPGIRFPEGLCSYLGQFLHNLALEDDYSAAVFTTECDQMRRGRDIASETTRRPVFLFHVPKTWRTDTSRVLYRQELERLSRFMIGLGGRRPDNPSLRREMIAFDSQRAHLRKARKDYPSRAFAEAVLRFQTTGILSLEEREREPTPASIPLALIGGPLMQNELELIDLIESTGGRVDLNATECGERTFPREFVPERLEGEALSELAEAYFGHIPDAFRRPNSQLYEWLASEVHHRRIRAAVLVRHLWCDTWHAEGARLREALGIPVLDIDLDGSVSAPRLKTRIQAFLEMLS